MGGKIDVQTISGNAAAHILNGINNSVDPESGTQRKNV